ncbi:MAG: ABC transporter ATP-binding protein [Candidatus Moranbacteria bacterium]|nr:ABC transporter ATP-binding protein [Candidatus Moranbacteria bacterium]MDD3965297.1 ABC transporter ATP-binding protein [Candidatus Moranbacteria bacterium]
MNKKGKPLSVWSVLRSYAFSVRRYKWSAVSVFVVYGLASVVSGILSPLVYRRIIDTLSGATDRILVSEILFQSLWMLIGVIVSYQFFYRAGDFIITFVESKTIEDLNNRAFQSFMRQGHTFFIDRFSGSLVAQARRYARIFEDVADQLVFNFWMPFVHLTGVIVTLFFIESKVAVIFLVWIPIYITIAIWITKKKLPYDTRSAEQDSLLTAKLSDALSNIFAVKTFASEEHETDVFSLTAKSDEQARLKSWRFNNVLIAIQTIMFSILEIMAMYVVLKMWIVGSVSTGTVVLVQVYIGSIFSELFGLGRAFGRLMKNVADASEMIETLERTDGEVLEMEDTLDNTTVLSSGGITFDHIVFRYSANNAVFDDFSLAIRPGEKVGLVGASGSGKSTLTKLLLGFIVPESGTISVGGQNVSPLSLQSLRRLIAYVPQDTALFHRTIAENISYGKKDASRSEIEAVAKKAHAHDFITALPLGYDTLVGERGVKLSGGERQRVAIARALLKDAPILVLDEATSALDTTSEHHIQEALHELMQGRTTLVIAHRLSTVREMDRIIVLENGKLAESGSHTELITQGGIYAGFWNRQTASFGDVLLVDEEEEK